MRLSRNHFRSSSAVFSILFIVPPIEKLLADTVCTVPDSRCNSHCGSGYTHSHDAVDWILINAGGVGMSVMNIGNTDFNNLVLDTGGGLTRLDFSGTYSEGKHICKSVIAGSKLSISVPQNAGESLQATTVAAPLMVSGEGWIQEIKNPVLKKYVTDDYETQSILIDIFISAAGSAIDVNCGTGSVEWYIMRLPLPGS
jgi:hypothetical protein